MDQARVLDILGGAERTPAAHAVRAAASLATPAYRAAVAARNGLFDAGLRRAAPLGRPTLSVGNLTTGGTGKTPVVLDACRRLLSLGVTPAVLMRGYRATADAGSDEANELRAAIPGLVVEPDPDRVAAAGRVLAARPDVGAFVLDDGFQHRRAARDVDLVLIDATRPWGFGRLLPRGLLREPVGALRRATAVVVTRADQATQAELAAIDARVAGVTGRPPIAHAAMRWSGLRSGDQTLPVDALAGWRVVALCGIGNPTAFEATLDRHAREVLAFEAFDDHHDYSVADWQAILHTAHETGCDAVVMTEKDWVKVARLVRGPVPLRVVRPALSLAFTRGEAEVAGLFESFARLATA